MNKTLLFLYNILIEIENSKKIYDEDLKKIIYIFFNTTLIEESIIAESILKKINQNIKIIKEPMDYDAISSNITNKHLRDFIYKRKD
jgi:hypothetical protein